MMYVFLPNCDMGEPFNNVEINRETYDGSIVEHNVLVSQRYIEPYLYQLENFQDIKFLDELVIVKDPVSFEEMQAHNYQFVKSNKSLNVTANTHTNLRGYQLELPNEELCNYEDLTFYGFKDQIQDRLDRQEEELKKQAEEARNSTLPFSQKTWLDDFLKKVAPETFDKEALIADLEKQIEQIDNDPRLIGGIYFYDKNPFLEIYTKQIEMQLPDDTVVKLPYLLLHINLTTGDIRCADTGAKLTPNDINIAATGLFLETSKGIVNTYFSMGKYEHKLMTAIAERKYYTATKLILDYVSTYKSERPGSTFIKQRKQTND